MSAVPKVNPAPWRPAPMKNVANFAMLLQRMVDREPYLPGLAVFFGHSGWGKTESAIYGANRHRARYVECGQYTTARTLLMSLLTELGEQKRRGTIEELLHRAIEILAADPRRPVIVDEAHFIAAKRFIDLLRELSDKSGAAVIMIGEENLPVSLEQFERVHNRVLEWLPAVSCDAEDFALLARSRLDGVTIAADLAEALLKQTRGNTRRIVINFARVQELSQVLGKDVITLADFGGPTKISDGRTPRRS
ncbi:AAA domain-containing protein [Mesorhizobium australicum]|uniref:AAA domain-containing protein n=2 Tax=Mesorhizobium australicum TaxID=536018 RepID=A0A1X7NVP7_9HYPH|nr:AAA domain-containing protein [Mesorhizobium australicum]